MFFSIKLVAYECLLRFDRKNDKPLNNEIFVFLSWLFLQFILESQLRELSRTKLFGKPGHGAPTENIKKKKFTEYQLDRVEKEMHDYNPYGDTEYDYGPRDGATSVARPPPDYRNTAEPPRPQTYDTYEQAKPMINGQEQRAVRSLINIRLGVL